MKTYNRLETGERIRVKRRLLGLTQEELAEKIGRVPKYCADIERGQCGMSIETMMAFAKTLNMSLDYMILGVGTADEEQSQTEELAALIHMLENCSERKIKYAKELLKLFLIACDNRDD